MCADARRHIVVVDATSTRIVASSTRRDGARSRRSSKKKKKKKNNNTAVDAYLLVVGGFVFWASPWSHGPYARARANPAMLCDPDLLAAALDLENGWKVLRVARKYVNTRDWRRAVQLRTTRIAVVLRAVERVLGDRYIWRVREAGAWRIFARNNSGEVVHVATVGGGPRRTLEDIRAPVPVEVIEPTVLDVERLKREVRGT